MKIRIISAIAALFIFIPVVIFSDTVVLPIAIVIVSLLGLFEMFRCCGVHKKVLFTLPYYLVAFLAPTLIYLLDCGVAPTLPLTEIFILTLVFLVLWSYPCAVFSKGALPVTDACTASIGAIYVTAAMSAILYIRQVLSAGGYIFLLIFIGAWITDIFAYFCGRAFGKHKLIPDVSPKKTIEGSIGGIVFCVLCFVLYGFLVERVFAFDVVRANYIALALSGFFISIVSQIGDLAMSLLKRHYGIKDFGKIMPGHGGVIDRFDSIFASTSILLICSVAASYFTSGGLFILL